jgi:hypothetical protein
MVFVKVFIVWTGTFIIGADNLDGWKRFEVLALTLHETIPGWRHDTQPNDIQHYDSRHINKKAKLSITTLECFAAIKALYAECILVVMAYID